MEESLFFEFLCEFVRKLEGYLRASENSLMIQECNALSDCKENHSRWIVSACGQTYKLDFCVAWPKGFEGSRFLLELAAREIRLLFDDPNFFRQGGDGHWCFDSYAHDWHTPETLARAVYEMICARTFQWLHDSFGLDPLSISRVADMAYESRNAKGEISFHTGDLLSVGEGIVAYPHEPVLFTEENARFIRKQFAGVGENSLLFMRDDSNQPYAYAGYLGTGGKTFLSVWIKQDGMWILSVDGCPILQVKSRDVFLPEDPISQTRYRTEFGYRAAEKLTPVLKALRGHKHGTSVIFLNGEDEASRKMLDRLEKAGRALRVEGVHIIDKSASKKKRESFDRMLGDIANVDGAFIFDYNTRQLLYVNAIVDGVALLPGRTECGARHNALESAITTLIASDSSRKVKAAAVIFSEDGGISTVTATSSRGKLEKDVSWRAQFPTLRM